MRAVFVYCLWCWHLPMSSHVGLIQLYPGDRRTVGHLYVLNCPGTLDANGHLHSLKCVIWHVKNSDELHCGSSKQLAKANFTENFVPAVKPLRTTIGLATTFWTKSGQNEVNLKFVSGIWNSLQKWILWKKMLQLVYTLELLFHGNDIADRRNQSKIEDELMWHNFKQNQA